MMAIEFFSAYFEVWMMNPKGEKQNNELQNIRESPGVWSEW